jgi:hypothetical protein
VAALAGNDGSQFFGIRAELGEGFFILIGYSILGSICHFLFHFTMVEFYHEHPFQKMSIEGCSDYFGPFLVKTCYADCEASSLRPD